MNSEHRIDIEIKKPLLRMLLIGLLCFSIILIGGDFVVATTTITSKIVHISLFFIVFIALLLLKYQSYERSAKFMFLIGLTALSASRISHGFSSPSDFHLTGLIMCSGLMMSFFFLSEVKIRYILYTIFITPFIFLLIVSILMNSTDISIILFSEDFLYTAVALFFISMVLLQGEKFNRIILDKTEGGLNSISLLAKKTKAIAGESLDQLNEIKELSEISYNAASATNQIEQQVKSNLKQSNAMDHIMGEVQQALDEGESSLLLMNQQAESQSELTQSSKDHFSEVVHKMDLLETITIKQAKQAKELKIKSERGLSSVEESISLMNQVTTFLDSIGHISNTIRDLAENTNVLSINAAIEASRAGLEGKGFSVVSNEIRKLAEISAQRASEIEEEIANLSQSISTTNTHLNLNGQIFSEISHEIFSIFKEMEKLKGSAQNLNSNGKNVLEQSSSLFSSASVVLEQSKQTLEVYGLVKKKLDEGKSLTEQIRNSVSEISTGVNQINDGSVQIKNLVNSFHDKNEELTRKISSL